MISAFTICPLWRLRFTLESERTHPASPDEQGDHPARGVWHIAQEAGLSGQLGILWVMPDHRGVWHIAQEAGLSGQLGILWVMPDHGVGLQRLMLWALGTVLPGFACVRRANGPG